MTATVLTPAWSEDLPRHHSVPALVAAGTGAAAAAFAGSASLTITAIAIAALVIGHGRSLGWRLSVLLDRPRLFSIASALYLPFFPIDLLLSARTEPISALVRLIVFLLVGEALSGTGSRSHRPLLFGLLLLMSAAAETTDVWFVLPLVAFGFAAVAAQIRWTLHAEEPPGASVGGAADPPARGVLPIVAGSLVLGSLFFFLIPRVGAGLGRRPSGASTETRMETGLSEQVSLNTLGRVKRRSTPVFRARLNQAGSAGSIDPESIYWRAMTYSRWTGSGWGREEDDLVRILRLEAGVKTSFPGAEEPRAGAGTRGARQGVGPGAEPGAKPGPVPDAEPGSVPGAKPGPVPGAEPGPEPGAESGPERGPGPSDELIAQPGAGPGAESGADPTIIAEIERLRAGTDALLSPGLPLWLRSPRPSVLVVSSDGTFRGARGTPPPRIYEVAARVVRPRRRPDRQEDEAGSRPGEMLRDNRDAVDGNDDRDAAVADGRDAAVGHSRDAAVADGRDPADGNDTSPHEVDLHDRPVAADRHSLRHADDQRRAPRETGRPPRQERALWRFLDARPADDEVARWAASIAPGETSGAELARAFERDLSTRQYSLDTTAIDPGRPIASFLGGAPGHCEYFASAMALGLRLRGVPARVVGGYLGADEMPFSTDLVVRESRAHLWVEVHLPEDGWTRFDPTPAGGRFLTTGRWPALRALWDRTAMAWDSTIVGLDLNDQLDAVLVARERAARLGAALRSAAPGLFAFAAVAAAISVYLVLRRRRRAARGEGGFAAWPSPPRFYRRLLALAARRGLVPAPSETASEFGRRVGAALGDPAAVSTISALYERARFGAATIPPGEISDAEAALARLRGTALRTP